MHNQTVLKWDELNSADREAWAQARACDSSLRSPFFSDAFADEVHRARGDVLVARLLDSSGEPAFLPFHRGAFGKLRPLAGPLSDWHGLVATGPGDHDLASAFEELRLPPLHFSATPDANPMGIYGDSADVSYVLDLSAGFEAYENQVRATSPKAFRNLRARRRKLDEGRATTMYIADDRRVEVRRWLMRAKGAQYRTTRQHDVFSTPWVRRLMDGLLERGREGLHGCVSSFWINGEIAAAHLGMVDGGVLHYWFPVYAEKFAGCSPGLLLLMQMAQQAQYNDWSEIDLGTGDYPFKQQLANRQVRLRGGLLARSGAGPIPRLPSGARLGAQGLRAISAKAARRLDRSLSFVEPSSLAECVLPARRGRPRWDAPPPQACRTSALELSCEPALSLLSRSRHRTGAPDAA